eukprot:gene26051-31454_t
MGERVEARMSPDHDFRGAIIVGVHRNGLYDVTFDDNGKECCDLHPNNIRKDTGEAHEGSELSLGDQNSISFVGGDPIEEALDKGSRYSKGETVEVMREGGSDWRLAVVAKVHEPRAETGEVYYDVIYSDHFREEQVPSLFVRRMFGQEPASAASTTVAEPKSVPSRPSDQAATLGRPRPAQPSPVPVPGRPRDGESQNKASPLFRAGQRVEARFHGGQLYYPGVVSQVLDARYVDILYDDGDAEASVPVDYVRPVAESTNPGGEDDERCAFRVGAKVEANFQG